MLLPSFWFKQRKRCPSSVNANAPDEGASEAVDPLPYLPLCAQSFSTKKGNYDLNRANFQCTSENRFMTFSVGPRLICSSSHLAAWEREISCGLAFRSLNMFTILSV